MKVLVTGGAGFIGSNLARAMLAAGSFEEVRVLDDLSTGYAENLTGLDVAFTEGSILDMAALERVADGVDSIVHLAAIPSVPRSVANPRASHDANATGTLNVLEAARATGVEQVIVASSSSVYGSNPTLPKNEDDWTRPLSPYAVSKLATEGYAIAYQASYGLKTLPFRFFNVYGPGQAAGHAYAAVVPKFIDAALSGQALEIHGDGRQSRDFTFVADVCRVIMSAVSRRLSHPGPVNLAFNTNTTLLELISELEAQLGETVAKEFTDPRVGDVRASQADSLLLRELFPDVTPLPLADGLSATLAWYRGRIGLDTGAS
ncbi:NAD-dependent epimerase/dehydratase family protein [Tessaracoccus flavus]|uniref:GDP-mannose 4,6-dehydratase n=1 Tax=Tessaracoccus flavus TaxID=1610493 RepID=A0A1Q2CI43_9ACTN|nr:NAD-dependent epimerase/dehydratase family protein [Tessaracoccus flavus]AQP45743.1 GDP-mannose 4,6-dehydratase [Tessaracoccus flavus]SDZ12411.1 UDP-glucose 4-epimerase [Tessaracoccus flavus]